MQLRHIDFNISDSMISRLFGTVDSDCDLAPYSERTVRANGSHDSSPSRKVSLYYFSNIYESITCTDLDGLRNIVESCEI